MGALRQLHPSADCDTAAMSTLEAARHERVMRETRLHELNVAAADLAVARRSERAAIARLDSFLRSRS